MASEPRCFGSPALVSRSGEGLSSTPAPMRRVMEARVGRRQHAYTLWLWVQMRNRTGSDSGTPAPNHTSLSGPARADGRYHNAVIVPQRPARVSQRGLVNRLRRFMSIEARIVDSA